MWITHYSNGTNRYWPIPHISTVSLPQIVSAEATHWPYEVSESLRLQLRPLWDAAPLPVLWSQMAPVGSWRPPLATRRMLDDVYGFWMIVDIVLIVLILCWYCVDIVLILCWYCVDSVLILCWYCWGRNGSPYPDTPKASTSFAKCQGALVPCEGCSLKTCLAPPHSWPWAGAGILDGDLRTAQDPGPTENQGRGQGRGQHVQSTSGVTATFQLSNCHSQVELPCALRKAPTFAMTSNKACMNCWENTAETLPWKAGYQRPNQEAAANQNQSMCSMDFGGTHSSYVHHVLDRFCLVDCLCRRYTTTLPTRMVSAKVHVWLHAVECIAGLSTGSKFRNHWFCNRAADVTCHTVPLWCFRWPGWYVLSTSSGSDLQLSFPPWSLEISCLWPKSEYRTCHIRSRCNSKNSDSNCVADSALCTCRVHWISARPSWGVCQWNVMEYGFASWESTQSAQCMSHAPNLVFAHRNH